MNCLETVAKTSVKHHDSTIDKVSSMNDPHSPKAIGTAEQAHRRCESLHSQACKTLSDTPEPFDRDP